MKGKTKFKSIFIKTAAMFFTFYLVMVIVFTVIYYKAKVNENKISFEYMQSVLRHEISESINDIESERKLDGRSGYWGKDIELNKDVNDLAELNSEISYLISDFSKGMFAKSSLYDENGNMIAKTRNLLNVGNEESEKSSKDDCYVSRYIDLDKCLSEDEEIELFKIQNNERGSKNYCIKGKGYINGAEIIPEVIEIYEIKVEGPVSVDEGIENGEKIKTYNFNVEGVEGLKKVDINSYLDSRWQISYNSDTYYNSNKNKSFFKKIFNRYNNLYEYSEDEIKVKIDNNGNINKWDVNEIYGKVNYDYIQKLSIYNHKYYIALQADYYPWEDILPKAIPLYAASFIMVLVMVIILSKGLYKTYEKQAALEKNRRELTSAIAHELKTPLGIIRTYGEGLKEKIAEDKKDYYLDVIIDETYKMDKMVLEMLDLSKLEAKSYELKKEDFCINNLIEEIIKKNEKLFIDKNICVNYTSDKKYNINADYYRIEQVINNLISNAIYHTDENKTINIILNDQIFNVENEGEHIPKDKINLIWDAFYRVDNSRDRSERRTGIGLAIVKNVLQLHNMEFGVENTNLGVKFWFKFFSV